MSTKTSGRSGSHFLTSARKIPAGQDLLFNIKWLEESSGRSGSHIAYISPAGSRGIPEGQELIFCYISTVGWRKIPAGQELAFL